MCERFRAPKWNDEEFSLKPSRRISIEIQNKLMRSLFVLTAWNTDLMFGYLFSCNIHETFSAKGWKFNHRPHSVRFTITQADSFAADFNLIANQRSIKAWNLCHFIRFPPKQALLLKVNLSVAFLCFLSRAFPSDEGAREIFAFDSLLDLSLDIRKRGWEDKHSLDGLFCPPPPPSQSIVLTWDPIFFFSSTFFSSLIS